MWFLPHRLGKAVHPMKPYGLKFKKKKKKGGGEGREKKRTRRRMIRKKR